MAQFDSLIISPLIFSTLFILFIYYFVSINNFIPNVSELVKFRVKYSHSEDFQNINILT